MPENALPVIHTVSYRPFDGGGERDAPLAAAREKALAGGCARGSARGVEAGRIVQTRYRVSPGEFRWRKTCGKAVLQEAFRRKEGFSLLTRGDSGALISETLYGPDLRWLRTAYYSGSPAKPDAVLSPGEDGLTLLSLDAESGKYRRRELLSCPYRPGTAEQSYVDHMAGGGPPVLARTDGGTLCFCTEAEREKRLALARGLAESGGLPEPDWPKEAAGELNFSYIRNDGSAAPESTRPDDFGQRAVPAFAEAVRELDSADYALDREVFCEEPPRPQPIPDPRPAPHPEPIPDPVPAPRPVPAKYGVAAKGLSGVVHRGPELGAEGLVPAKRIVVSEAESYLYFGELIGGLRQGQGRTQMAGGHTAYEGGYADDLRDGFGVYYYKSGRLCYAGSWKRNLRDGLGVAFGSADGSVFVGRWKDGIPTGRGTAFDMEGNLLYSGEWKDGRRHGRGTEYRGGHVVRSGEWRDGQFASGWARTGDPQPGADR